MINKNNPPVKWKSLHTVSLKQLTNNWQKYPKLLSQQMRIHEFKTLGIIMINSLKSHSLPD